MTFGSIVSRMYTPYTANAFVIFVSSFLLFEIQFIAGKHFLPHFGGSSGVWATSLLFFTTLLFVGYAYVFFLARARVRTQVVLHATLCALAVLGVAASFLSSGSLFAVVDPSGGSPYLDILRALMLSVAVPYLILASTSPLLQFWFGLSHTREPYTLYAVSNVGSALALLSYPFLIEPFFDLNFQGLLWAVLFCLAAFSAASIGLLRIRNAPVHANAAQPQTVRDNNSSGTCALWVLGGALPSFMLVAVTTNITETLAPVPLLWMLPLFLYLVSFIFAFSGRSGGIWSPLLMLISAIAAFLMLDAHPFMLLWQILAYLTVLFFTGMTCHGAVYNSRPNTKALPLFYLALSLGGALGALAGSIIAPLIFSDFSEFPLAVALAGGVAAYLLPDLFFPRILHARGIRFARFIFICLIIAFFFRSLDANPERTALQSRNFYGSASIVFNTDTTVLMHGTTVHGFQLNDRASRGLPTSYYTQGSGISRAISFLREERGGALSIGVLGLGTGSVAAYCEPGDRFVFYEIDPRITRIAYEQFSYLSRCTGAQVREGDGRLVLEDELEQQKPGAYDVLLLDAFSNDKAPVHLLTLEAMQTYAAHLSADDAIIVVHVSSRYLDIAPVIVRLATKLGFTALLVNNVGQDEYSLPSRWVLLSRDQSVFSSVYFARSNHGTISAKAPLWTDTYTSIVPLLYMPTIPGLD